jgi:diacylglycerol kinase family enzyme
LTPDAPHSPSIDPASPLLFIINGASGRNNADVKRDAVLAALSSTGRTGELLFAQPAELARVAAAAAASALARRSAVVAVGGDGTINAVAQAAHAQGCPLGVVAQGTFNYFARTHGIPTEIDPAVRGLLRWAPVPVQVGTVNDHLFLVNASLGMYPELLQDREAYKSRFGRSRMVALLSALATLTREHRQLRLHVQHAGHSRDVRTPTLFVGNNRLQMEQVGLREAPALDAGRLAAVMLRPIRTRSMLWLLLHGAFGTLGDAPTVESFEFEHMVVKPRQPFGGRLTKVAFDGEITWLRSPLEFRVPPRPLFLLKPQPAADGPAAEATS